MAGKRRDLSERGLGIVGSGVCGGGGVVYGCWGFNSESKILFGDIECSSFRWLFLENSMQMKNLSIVFRCVPFSRYCRTCTVWSMGPNVCNSSRMCLV